jgi:hypothetical protein
MEKGKSWQLGLLRAIQPTRNPHTRAPAQLPLTRTRRPVGLGVSATVPRLITARGWLVGPMRPADLTSLSRARSSHSHWFAGPHYLGTFFSADLAHGTTSALPGSPRCSGRPFPTNRGIRTEGRWTFLRISSKRRPIARFSFSRSCLRCRKSRCRRATRRTPRASSGVRWDGFAGAGLGYKSPLASLAPGSAPYPNTERHTTVEHTRRRSPKLTQSPLANRTITNAATS